MFAAQAARQGEPHGCGEYKVPSFNLKLAEGGKQQRGVQLQVVVIFPLISALFRTRERGAGA